MHIFGNDYPHPTSFPPSPHNASLRLTSVSWLRPSLRLIPSIWSRCSAESCFSFLGFFVCLPVYQSVFAFFLFDCVCLYPFASNPLPVRVTIFSS